MTDIYLDENLSEYVADALSFLKKDTRVSFVKITLTGLN